MVKRVNRLLKSEKGSISLEFLGVLPFLFLFMLLLWQAVASGVAIIRTQSATNEATRVYATTHDQLKAENKAKDIIGSGSIMTYKGLEIIQDYNDDDFKTTVDVDLSLVFIPKQWRGDKTAIPFQMSATGKELQ